MAPAVLWYEHVLGLEQCWEIAFHTSDAERDAEPGVSGLRSVVLWDPRSGLKFASNEPLRPNFEVSQISVFCDEHRGSGVQHVALVVDDIVGAVAALRARGARFARTPSAYYDTLPARLARAGRSRTGSRRTSTSSAPSTRSWSTARPRGVTSSRSSSTTGAGAQGDPGKGPFFFELIQRRGDDGFGAGNFRALFESIAVAQEGARAGLFDPPPSKPR